MLEGITVLNQTEIAWFGEDVITVLIMIVIGCFAGMLINGCLDNEVACISCAIGGILLGVLILILLIANANVSTGRYRYECTIDESVSMKEVYERYEIIEQRGDIWVLEDKE